MYSSVQCASVHLTSVQCVNVHLASVQCVSVHLTSVQCESVHLTSVQCASVHLASLQCVSVLWGCAAVQSAGLVLPVLPPGDILIQSTPCTGQYTEYTMCRSVYRVHHVHCTGQY